MIFIGRVQNVVVANEEQPLVYFSRTYHRLNELTDLQWLRSQTKPWTPSSTTTRCHDGSRVSSPGG